MTPHPENDTQESRFVRQDEEITRLSLRLSMKLIMEEIGDIEYVDDDARSRVMQAALMISESRLGRLFSLASMLRQASSKDVDEVYDSTARVIEAAKAQLKG